jgi:hypothetical protein
MSASRHRRSFPGPSTGSGRHPDEGELAPVHELSAAEDAGASAPSRPRSFRGFVAAVSRASVRDLVMELASIEDALRDCGDERGERNRLLAREGCVIAELRARRRRWRSVVGGPQLSFSSLAPRSTARALPLGITDLPVGPVEA